MTRAHLPLLALVLCLAACGSGTKKAGAGAAEGEVLPGSASDAMLPYDSVKSQAPLAPQSEGGDKPGGKKSAAGNAKQNDTSAASPAAPDTAPASDAAPPSPAAQ
ncbi:MAG: hypothetical protein JSR28_05615 [Proteobacteria bacterium]|nr:hypothetical protein [Pseudomonadota bacterium]